MAEQFLQLLYELVPVGRAHTAELLQKGLFDVHVAVVGCGVCFNVVHVHRGHFNKNLLLLSSTCSTVNLPVMVVSRANDFDKTTVAGSPWEKLSWDLLASALLTISRYIKMTVHLMTNDKNTMQLSDKAAFVWRHLLYGGINESEGFCSMPYKTM